LKKRGFSIAQRAVAEASQQWMGWTIGRIISKEYGILRRLPYLTGFVIHTTWSIRFIPALRTA